jgi:hypothetical protein
MTTFWWAKATFGLYYLREGEKGADRTVAAKVARADDGSYLITIFIPGQEHTSRHFTTPAGAIKRVEARLRELYPAHFAKENF